MLAGERTLCPAEGDTLSGVPCGMRTVSGRHSGDTCAKQGPKGQRESGNLSGKRTEHTFSTGFLCPLEGLHLLPAVSSRLFFCDMEDGRRHLIAQENAVTSMQNQGGHEK